MNHERYLGTYGVHGDLKHTGELVIAGADTRLKFIGRDLEVLDNVPTIYGRTEKNEKVSCFDCFTSSTAQPFFDSDDHIERMEMLPNFTLIGDEHLEPDESAIHEVRFKLNDTEKVFEDRNAFGSIFGVKDELQEIFDGRVPPLKKTARKNSLISYFCGEYNIVTCKSHLGIFTAYYNFEAESGRPFSHNVGLSLKFDEPIQFRNCLERTGAIRRFFSVVTGRSQDFLSLEVLVSKKNAIGSVKNTALRVHFARTKSGPVSKIPHHFMDAPINPIRRTEEFASVMKAWLAMDESRYLSRRQYVECIEDESHYTTNRLVAAANMFDTLPADALPTEVTLPSDFLAMVGETIIKFRNLSKTDYRDSLIAHLGRLQKPSLPAKLYHRSALIHCRVDNLFPNLNEVLRIAGQFRNYLVHGGTKFDYKKYDVLLPFLTDTLEFVFAASDLIDAGWDLEQWCSDRIWGDHQFTRFLRDYPQQIETFLIAKNRPRS